MRFLKLATNSNTCSSLNFGSSLPVSFAARPVMYSAADYVYPKFIVERITTNHNRVFLCHAESDIWNLNTSFNANLRNCGLFSYSNVATKF